jgi:transposase
MCPGNNESAGKRRSGKTRKGDRWLRRSLTQAAWAASKTKKTYLAAQYNRLASRRGKKRAIVAVGHSILQGAYHMLRNHQPYADLGPDHFLKMDPERTKRFHVRRLEQLGYSVTLTTSESVTAA